MKLKIALLFVFLLQLIVSAQAAEIERISVSSASAQGNRDSYGSSISEDGRFVAFASAANNLVVNDTSRGRVNIFVRDRDTGVTERVSVSSDGKEANGSSFSPAISTDGRYIAFLSYASNLVRRDNNRETDIFVHDRVTGVTKRVSVSSSGEQGNDRSSNPSVSADGRFVAFESFASNLVEGDTNKDINSSYYSGADVFIHDRQSHETKRISVSASGIEGNDDSRYPNISADGRFVVFSSNANNLIDGRTIEAGNIYIYNRKDSINRHVSVFTDGVSNFLGAGFPAISADGQFVTFLATFKKYSSSERQIYIRDRKNRITERVSYVPKGVSLIHYRSELRESSVSADGRFVVYNDKSRIYTRDRSLNKTQHTVTGFDDRVSGGFRSKISADGRYVTFTSDSPYLVEGHNNYADDVFVIKNTRDLLGSNLAVSVYPTSGAVKVGEYAYFRARLTNTGKRPLKDCKAQIINPLVNWQRQFSFFSWPLNEPDPILNGGVDIAPGETAQIQLTVLPRQRLRQEVRFIYVCKTTKSYSIPFVNTIHLTAKTQALNAEDFVEMTNAERKTELVFDLDSTKYWLPYLVELKNKGSQPASINLSTKNTISLYQLNRSNLCVATDPANGDWRCESPRAEQIQVNLAAGEDRILFVYVHAKRRIRKELNLARIFLEARDRSGELVAKNSMGVYTISKKIND